MEVVNFSIEFREVCDQWGVFDGVIAPYTPPHNAVTKGGA